MTKAVHWEETLPLYMALRSWESTCKDVRGETLRAGSEVCCAVPVPLIYLVISWSPVLCRELLLKVRFLTKLKYQEYSHRQKLA